MAAACAVLLLLAAVCAAAPFQKAPDSAALGYMRRFGYLAAGTSDSEAIYTQSALEAAVKRVQLFGGLAQTGQWDNQTQQLLTSPRCGVADEARADGSRRRRFVVGAPGWNKRHLTYFVSNWSPRLGEVVVRDALVRAFAAWAGYARLSFAPAASRDLADIEVLFGSGPHGDRHAFDGVGRVLAHAYFPYEQDRLGGDMHFDADEPWTSPDVAHAPDEGVDFFSVAVHELGHSLGLAHSPEPSSVMFPYYQSAGEASNAQPLGYDDILAVYQLYISRRLPEDDLTTNAPVSMTTPAPRRPPVTKTTPSPRRPSVNTPTPSPRRPVVTGATSATPTATDAPAPDICAGSWDAAAHLRGELMVFKGPWLWRLSQRGRVQPGYPVPFRRLFPLPSDVHRVDAAYQRPVDESIVLFAGTRFWVFDGSAFIEGSPKSISSLGLPASLASIDAAQVWAKNGKTFLYSGDEYWRFDAQGSLEAGYPRSMARWRGVPSPLDAALTWTDNATYFFQDASYWRFDNERIKANERYPLPSGPYWLGCPEPLSLRR